MQATEVGILAALTVITGLVLWWRLSSESSKRLVMNEKALSTTSANPLTASTTGSTTVMRYPFFLPYPVSLIPYQSYSLPWPYLTLCFLFFIPKFVLALFCPAQSCPCSIFCSILPKRYLALCGLKNVFLAQIQIQIIHSPSNH